MSLEAKLAEIRDGAATKIPAETRAVMTRATEELRASGIMDRVIRIGDPLPPFALANASGVEIRSADLVAKGPLVLTVFRGHW